MAYMLQYLKLKLEKVGQGHMRGEHATLPDDRLDAALLKSMVAAWISGSKMEHTW